MTGRLRIIPVLLVLFAAAAHADDPPSCASKCRFGQDLEQPYVIEAEGGVLDTELRVELKDLCVPVWVKDSTGKYTCSERKMTLPTYGFPKGKGFQYGYPGPTLRIRKADRPGVDMEGDRLRVKLVNAMPPGGPTAPDGCNACPSAEECAKLGGNAPKCCKAKDTFPNCFHGDNSTNLHFHGTHVSPQPPQDYVLLELQPAGTQPLAAGAAGQGAPHGPAHGRGTVAVGQYQYDVQPLRWTQPEGSHWYHPHKHGSTSLQVSSGMAGALLIEGAFDDWLHAYYGEAPSGRSRLEEKVLVIQQIHPLNFYVQKPDRLLPQPLVNGQAAPKIYMYPGQIQRWRVIGATMEGAAQIEFDFSGPLDKGALEAQQIAMDGIQFAPENYGRQPLLPESDEFQLSPGNRADFLVLAPKKEGPIEVTFDVFGRIEGGDGREELRQLLEQRAPKEEEPTLLTVQVVSCERYRRMFPNTDPDCPAMDLPTEAQWPRMPPYLWDIQDARKTHTLRFALNNVDTGQPANTGQQPTKFFINLTDDPQENRQYDPACVDITATLGTAEEWTVINETNSDPFHVFHIHTNPFQIVQNGKEPNTPPYVWQDAITLPASTNGQVVIRQRFEQFTGEYVLHCHFLGHEDRGMMLSVQVVCPKEDDKDPDMYGVARSTHAPECLPGNLLPAAPRCAVPKSSAPAATHAH